MKKKFWLNSILFGLTLNYSAKSIEKNYITWGLSHENLKKFNNC